MGKLLPPAGAWRAWLSRAVCAGVFLLVSCGGGGGPGGDTQAGVGSGGTGAYSNGAINSFGSIVVNGVHYDHTSAASIEKVGDTTPAGTPTPHLPGDLKLGMTVEIDVAPVGEGGKLKIRYGSELLGPASGVNLVTQTLTVMGQEVGTFYIDEKNRTQFGDDLEAGPVSPDVVNRALGVLKSRVDSATVLTPVIVEIYGFEDASTGKFIATRIEHKPAYSGTYVTRGVIQSLVKDSSGNVTSCMIGKQKLVYPTAGGYELPKKEMIVDGAVARIELYGSPDPIDGSWSFTQMTLNEPLPRADRGVALIGGLVTKIADDSVGDVVTRFSVNGVDVDARLIDCPACKLLTVGQRLSVKGALVSGVIMATEVKKVN